MRNDKSSSEQDPRTIMKQDQPASGKCLGPEKRGPPNIHTNRQTKTETKNTNKQTDKQTNKQTNKQATQNNLPDMAAEMVPNINNPSKGVLITAEGLLSNFGSEGLLPNLEYQCKALQIGFRITLCGHRHLHMSVQIHVLCTCGSTHIFLCTHMLVGGCGKGDRL